VSDRKGQTFTCTATLDGQRVELVATVTGPGGQFTVVPKSAIIVVSSQTAQLADDIEKEAHVRGDVDCGSRSVIVVEVGATFTCTVTFPEQKPRTVTVKVMNVQGDFGYTVAPAESAAPTAPTAPTTPTTKA
jgi:hypothetical protein